MKHLLLVFAVLVSLSFTSAKRPTAEFPCYIYGRVFFETNQAYADHRVFIEEDEGFADILVFMEDNPLAAQEVGHWHEVESRALADFVLYKVTDKAYADFSVYYTDEVAFAGCQQ